MTTSKALRRISNDAARRWRCTSFAALLDQLSTPYQATLRLPIMCPPSTRHASSSTPLTVELNVSTNHTDVITWLQFAHYGFVHLNHPNKADSKISSSSSRDFASIWTKDTVSSPQGADCHTDTLVAKNALYIHIGPPRQLHYPLSIDNSTQHWCDFVMREQAHQRQYNMLDTMHDPHALYAASPSQHTRWFSQRLLDGFVSRRVCAHTGYGTTWPQSLDYTRQTTTDTFTPPYAMSSYYAADEELRRWAVFGEPQSLLPCTSTSNTAKKNDDPQNKSQHNNDVTNLPEAQLHRAIALSYLSAVLPQLHALWLSGAAVVNRNTGKSVLLLGPPRSGKTTLALHLLNASRAHSLVGHDEIALASADAALPNMASVYSKNFDNQPNNTMHASTSDIDNTKSDTRDNTCESRACVNDKTNDKSSILLMGVPGGVRVGLGAILGSLHPNPRLAAHVQPPMLQNRNLVHTLLRNSEGVLWNMSETYPVHIHELFDDDQESIQRVQPAALTSLAGIVWLGWSKDKLYRTAPHEAHSRVRRAPLLNGGLEELQHLSDSCTEQDINGKIHTRHPIFKSHYLLNSIYNDSEAWRQFTDVIGHTAQSETSSTINTQLYLMEGSINFKHATEIITDLLKK